MRSAVETINMLMKEVCDKQTQLRIELPKIYLNRGEYKEDMRELKNSIRELSEKVDKLLLRT
jgi:hypothetical protein